MSKVMSVFARNLSKIRKVRGWSQAQLAELIDVSVTTITFYETKRSWPTRENIAALAKALKVREMDFFKEDGGDSDSEESLPLLTREQLKEIIPPDLALEIVNEVVKAALS